MTKEELEKEIEFIHGNRTDIKFLRPLEVMSDVIVKATTTYTNLSLFMNDYNRLYSEGLISESVYYSALHDLYLLALLHTSCDDKD